MAFTNARYRTNAIIKRLGTADDGTGLITLRQRTGGTIDPVTGLLSGETIADHVVPGAIEALDENFENKTDIENAVYQTVLSAWHVTFTPVTGDVVIVADGTKYRVLRVEPEYIGTTISAWALYLEA